MRRIAVTLFWLALCAGTVHAQTVYTPPSNAPLSGTSTAIGGSALVAGACASTTVTISGATTAMVPVVSPNTYPGAGMDWFGYVSAANTVTVQICATVAGTPVSSTYNVRVLQ